MVKKGEDKMRCVFCGGKVENKIVTFEYQDGGQLIVVENVPAEVCESCGERTYSPEVADKLLHFAHMEYPSVRTIQVPVFDFAQTA